jgi:hypothetical protein
MSSQTYIQQSSSTKLDSTPSRGSERQKNNRENVWCFAMTTVSGDKNNKVYTLFNDLSFSTYYPPVLKANASFKQQCKEKRDAEILSITSRECSLWIDSNNSIAVDSTPTVFITIPATEVESHLTKPGMVLLRAIIPQSWRIKWENHVNYIVGHFKKPSSPGVLDVKSPLREAPAKKLIQNPDGSESDDSETPVI